MQMNRCEAGIRAQLCLAAVRVRSDFEIDSSICGYGTARCRRKCQEGEYKIGRCVNTYACCLRKWDDSLLNITKI
ncbi:beta-defensin 104A-like [Tupaia chinensis]|uniref:beta-defensin 104A-like n=1 Tax=Tupaia chinensis TaxID=246437 RepID=UPI000FFC794D|nr:beta-defensin 104A-like [Tupaia chinensis]